MKGGKGTASRTVGLLGGIFTFAVNRGLSADNPVRGVKRFTDRKYERFLSDVELARLGDALATAEREGTETMFMIAAIRLLLFTGARLGEILGTPACTLNIYFVSITSRPPLGRRRKT